MNFFDSLLWEIMLEISHVVLAIFVAWFIVHTLVKDWKLGHGGFWIKVSSGELLSEGLKVIIEGEMVEIVEVDLAGGRVKVKR